MPRLSTLAWLAFWGFLIWFVISNPTGAAQAAHNLGAFLSRAAHSISTFLTSL